MSVTSGTSAALPRVVIVGAGFGGLWAARTLAGREVEVVLVERNNYHTFVPLLYQVAAAELVPSDIAHPVRAIFRRAPNVTVRMAEVTRVDPEHRLVHTRRGVITYDRLILAPGSVTHFFGVAGAAAHAFPLRWMSDAVPLRHQILTRFEEADACTDARERRRLLTFVIVGGGATGVEFAGALAELVHGPLRRDFPAIGADEVSIVLLEAGHRVLPTLPERLSAFAERRLTARGVEVRTGARVCRVTPAAVELDGGARIATDTVVWTAGIQGDPRAAAWGLPVGPGGRVRVDPFLRVEGVEDVFVVGDLAYIEDEKGRPLPQVAQVAIQQGRCAAENAWASLTGGPLRRFRYRDLGMLAVIGRNAAVAHVLGRAFRGFAAWVLWLTIHIAWLVGFRNRVLVLLNWAWNYVFYRSAVRLVVPVMEPRSDGDAPAAGNI